MPEGKPVNLYSSIEMRVPHPSLISFEYVVENIPIDGDDDFANGPHFIEHPAANGILPPANAITAPGPSNAAAIMHHVPPQYQLMRQALPPDSLFYQR